MLLFFLYPFAFRFYTNYTNLYFSLYKVIDSCCYYSCLELNRMARIWTTTIPNPLNDTNNTKSDNSHLNNRDNRSELTNTAAMLLTPTTTTTTTSTANNSSSNRSTTITMLNEKEKQEFMISNQEYNEFWRKIKGKMTGAQPIRGSTRISTRGSVVKNLPDLTFSWEGIWLRLELIISSPRNCEIWI